VEVAGLTTSSNIKTNIIRHNLIKMFMVFKMVGIRQLKNRRNIQILIMLACFFLTYNSLRLNRVETSFRTILKSVFTTMKLTNETVEDLLEIIPQRCATKQLQIIAHVAMPARKHITASKIFTTPKNTKESFAQNFLID
jgi:hypothetical protein